MSSFAFQRRLGPGDRLFIAALVVLVLIGMCRHRHELFPAKRQRPPAFTEAF